MLKAPRHSVISGDTEKHAARPDTAGYRVPGRYFPMLDGMRGVAALAVVALHAKYLVGADIAPGGYLAVDLFFVLSGVVIANAYENRLLQGLSALAFLRLRIARFYPLYLAGLALGVAAFAVQVWLRDPTRVGYGGALAGLLAGVLFMPTPIHASMAMYPLNVPSWSLLYELAVNLAYAALLPRLSNRALSVIALIAAAALVAIGVFAGDISEGWHINGMPCGAARAVFSFSVGILIYRLKPQLPAIPAPYLLAATALLLVAPMPPAWRLPYDLMFVFLASPILVIIGTRSQPHSLGTVKICSFLGVSSFIIYALHWPLVIMAKPLVDRFAPGFGLPAALGIVIGLLAISRTIDAIYDQPARRAVAKLLSGTPALLLRRRIIAP